MCIGQSPSILSKFLAHLPCHATGGYTTFIARASMSSRERCRSYKFDISHRLSVLYVLNINGCVNIYHLSLTLISPMAIVGRRGPIPTITCSVYTNKRA